MMKANKKDKYNIGTLKDPFLYRAGDDVSMPRLDAMLLYDDIRAALAKTKRDLVGLFESKTKRMEDLVYNIMFGMITHQEEGSEPAAIDDEKRARLILLALISLSKEDRRNEDEWMALRTWAQHEPSLEEEASPSYIENIIQFVQNNPRTDRARALWPFALKLIEELPEVEPERSLKRSAFIQIAKNFYDKKACFQKALLFFASEGYDSLVRSLIDEAGAEVDKAETLHHYGEYFRKHTPLDRAVRKGRANVFRVLIGKDPNLIENSDLLPSLLIFAAKAGNWEIMASLVDAGADLNVSGRFGKTPLILALEKGYANIARELINKGACVNQADEAGRMPLVVALKTFQRDIVDLLIKKGADTQGVLSEGANGLILLVFQGQVDCAKELIPAFMEQFQGDLTEKQKLYLTSGQPYSLFRIQDLFTEEHFKRHLDLYYKFLVGDANLEKYKKFKPVVLHAAAYLQHVLKTKDPGFSFFQEIALPNDQKERLKEKLDYWGAIYFQPKDKTETRRGEADPDRTMQDLQPLLHHKHPFHGGFCAGGLILMASIFWGNHETMSIEAMMDKYRDKLLRLPAVEGPGSLDEFMPPAAARVSHYQYMSYSFLNLCSTVDGKENLADLFEEEEGEQIFAIRIDPLERRPGHVFLMGKKEEQYFFWDSNLKSFENKEHIYPDKETFNAALHLFLEEKYGDYPRVHASKISAQTTAHLEEEKHPVGHASRRSRPGML
jgi:hypothetical protein